MADPLLTSLCAICHVSAPRYKCPRCNIRTCSLACVKKHKAWSECSGERDPTAYVPRSKLHTAAGVDHDYNFLHGIELAAERAERVFVGDKGIMQEEELRPLTTQEVRWKTGRDGRKRKVLVTRMLRQPKGRTFEKFLASKLKKLNVVVVCAPLGMTRQKENHTTLNRRTGRINWQVEWLTLEAKREDEQKTTRFLSKVMDDAPLYQAYQALLGGQAKAQEQQRLNNMAARGSAQGRSDSRWQSAGDTLQDPSTGTWVLLQRAAMDVWPREKEDTERRQFQFFLARTQTRADLPTTITRLKPEDCLRNILANTRVLEFPTIYVLKRGEAIPSGFVLGPKDTVPPQQNQQQQQHQQLGIKRRGGPQRDKGAAAARSGKRRKLDGKNEMEEGEIESDAADEARNSADEDEIGAGHEDSGPKGPDGLEAGEVIAEQDLGDENDEEEDDDDDMDSDDDSTSSWGSDSE